MDKAVTTASTCASSHLDTALPHHGPLHLYTQQLWPKIEDQVVPLITDWHEDTETHPYGLERDRLLGDHTPF